MVYNWHTMNTGNIRKSILKHLDFIVFDLIILELSYFIATWYYSRSHYVLANIGTSAFRRQMLALFISLAVSLALEEPYKHILRRTKWAELGKMIQHTLFLAMTDVVLLFFIHDIGITSRLVTAYMWIIYTAADYLVRLVWKRVIRNYFIHRREANRQIVICTDHYNMEAAVNGILSKDFRDYDICGVFLSDYDPVTDKNTEISEVPVRGNTDDMMDYVTHHWTDDVILSLRDQAELSAELTQRLETAGVSVHSVVLNFYGSEESTEYHVEKLGTLIAVSQLKREIPLYEWVMKKIMDIVGGIIGCILTGIIFIFIAPLIYMKSPGPIFFVQDRVGRNGKVFKMYKFRSMYMDAEERKKELMEKNQMSDGMMFKMEDDPRIIGSEKKDRNGNPKGIGNFIRNTSLDEFPQFFNVLKGDMSLVGTRPPTLDEWAKYSEHHRKRLSMRPGITGLWQVSGRSEITDFEKIVELDSRYIDNWTIAMDIRILFRTIGMVLSRKGAK